MATQKLIQAQVPDPGVPGAPQVRSMQPKRTDVHNALIGLSIDQARAEIDDAYADMKTFHNTEPDHIMRMCGGHSARLSEIRTRIMRVEDWERDWRDLRVREIEPTLEELRNQREIASRLHAVREFDFKMEGGMT